MSAKRKRPKDSPEKQHARFLKAAEEAQLDPAAFERAFKRLDLRKKPPQPK